MHPRLRGPEVKKRGLLEGSISESVSQHVGEAAARTF